MVDCSGRFDRGIEGATDVAKGNERDYVALLEDEATTGGGLALAGWGLTTVAACVLGFASWQYAPPRSAPTELARADASLPDPSEVTGSIAFSDRGQTTVGPSRVVGAARVAPMPIAANETVATSRDIEQLRSEIKELQRRLAAVGQTGDGMARRVDKIEEKLAGDPTIVRDRLAALPVIPAGEPTSSDRIVERSAVPLPVPRPSPDQPIVTGSIPPKATEPTGEAAPKTARIVTPAAPSDGAKTAAAPESAKPLPGIEATRPATSTEPVKSATQPEPAKPSGLAAAVATTGATMAPAPQPTSQPPAPAAPATAPETTGSISASPDAAALDLGGHRSLASLKRAWSDMTTRYSEFGARMEPLARLRETDSGMEARLLAGPYSNQAEAAKSCMRLKALGVSCAVTTYSGQPLAGVK